jgi:hypothetical protein
MGGMDFNKGRYYALLGTSKAPTILSVYLRGAPAPSICLAKILVFATSSVTWGGIGPLL